MIRVWGRIVGNPEVICAGLSVDIQNQLSGFSSLFIIRDH